MIKTRFLRFDELYLPNIHIPTLYVFDVRTECVCIPTGVLYYGFTKYMYGVTLDTLQIVHEKRNQLCYFAQKIWSCVKLGMVSSSSSFVPCGWSSIILRTTVPILTVRTQDTLMTIPFGICQVSIINCVRPSIDNYDI